MLNGFIFVFPDLKWVFCRFDGPRGPRFEPSQQRFSVPHRFDGQHFGMPPRGNQTRPGPPGRFENPLRIAAASRFERPPGSLLGPPTGPPPPSSPASQAKTGPVNPSNSQLGTPDSSQGSLPQSLTIDKNENKTLQIGTEEKSMSDDVMDSNDSFFVQSDPIPQSQADIAKKAETVKKADKEEDSKKDIAERTASSPSVPVPPKQMPSTASKITEAAENINAPQQQPQPSQQGPFQPDIPKESPGKPHEMNQSGPPHALRGRGQGQAPLPMRGRGRGHGRGQIGRHRGPPSMSDPTYHREGAPYDHQPPMEEEYGWGDHSQEPHGMMDDQEAHEMWHSEEHHFQKEYYEDTEKQAPSRGRLDPADEPPEHWEEEQSEYWEEGDPYWAERRPQMMHHRPSFPPEGPRRPPFQPRFMHHGPRRPPPSLDMVRNPRGPPPPHMGPRFRRGGPGPWGPPPRHDMMRRPPPPPHELLEREPVGPPKYLEEMDMDPGWTHPHGREPRHPPLPPPEIERDMRRPPIRAHPMARDRWRRPPHEEPQSAYEQEYCPEDDGFGRPPPEAYHHRDHRKDDEFYHSREEWRRDRTDCDFPPAPLRGPPPDHLRDDPWREERDRSFSYENEDRARQERRGPGYADGPLYRDREPPFHSRPDWERPPPPPLPERLYQDPTEETYDRNVELPMAPQSNVPEAPLDQMSPGGTKTVLALSQRQHEIILKAAQELKMIRY